MNKFVSISVATRNEAGRKEVTIEYAPSLWRWLTRQPKKVTFEQIGDVWWNKASSTAATAGEVIDINQAVLEVESNTAGHSLAYLKRISDLWNVK